MLDLFAGSGALGLEALSRGAAGATFVDDAGAAISAIKANLAALGADAEVRSPHRLPWARRWIEGSAQRLDDPLSCSNWRWGAGRAWPR